MMPYRIEKITIRICAQTFPFAAKIREVTPTSAAISVSGSKSRLIRLEIMIIIREPIQRPHSFLDKFLIGFVNVILLY